MSGCRVKTVLSPQLELNLGLTGLIQLAPDVSIFLATEAIFHQLVFQPPIRDFGAQQLTLVQHAECSFISFNNFPDVRFRQELARQNRIYCRAALSRVPCAKIRLRGNKQRHHPPRATDKETPKARESRRIPFLM